MKSKITLLFALTLFSFGSFATNHIINFGGSFNNNYVPNSLTVEVGDSVQWWGDFMSHPLQENTAPAGAAAFGYNNTNPIYTYVVTIAGDYTFQCAVHGFTGQFTATDPVGVSTVTPQNEIAIYPTTIHSFLKINLPSEPKNLFVEVKNIVGQTQFKTELSNAVVNTIDLSNLNNGFYFVVIRNEMDIVKVVRIVKE